MADETPPVEVTLPVWVRVGSGEERQIGTVTGASVEELMPMVASLLRCAADEADSFGEIWARPGEEALSHGD